jgi:hypothetical protein
LGDGLILTGGGTGVNPGKLSLEGEFVEQMPNAAVLLPSEPYHHEATLNPRGDLVGLGKTFIYWEGQPLEVFSLTAFDTISDAITFEWSAAEALDAGTFQLGQDLTDPFHANAIQWVTDDLGEAIWVNMKGVNTIARISPATGEVTHMLGAEHGFDLLDAQGLPLDDSEWFFGQHAPRFKDNQLLVFNNGMAGPLGQTSVELHEVNVSAHTLTRLWKYTRPGWYEPYFGEGDWLPNGNIMVVSGHCTGCVAKPGTSFVAEVNPAINEVT